MTWIVKLSDGRYYVRKYLESSGSVPEISFTYHQAEAFKFPNVKDAHSTKEWIESTHSKAEVIKFSDKIMNKKELNRKAAIAVISDLIEKISLSYRDQVSQALDVLRATTDERVSVLGKLDSAVEGAHNMLRRTTYVDSQTLLAKIDSCLFEDDWDFDSVIINHDDFIELFVKNIDKVRSRYNENSSDDEVLKHLEPMKTGRGGTLRNRHGNVSKTIYWSYEIDHGEVLGCKKF
jgi:hypothetical protein